MNTKSSIKLDNAYQQFKKDCTLVSFVSTKTGEKKQLIKYRGKVYQSASYQEVFTTVRAQGILIII